MEVVTVSIGHRWCGDPTWGLYDSMMQLLHPPGRAFRVLRPPKPMDICSGGNWIANAFLATGDDWILWVDTDCILHPGTLLRLLSWQQPIVGALCVSKNVPRYPVVFKDRAPGPNNYWVRVHDLHRWIEAHPAMLNNDAVCLEPRPEKCLYAVNFTGLHCLLVHRSVLEALDPPWFTPEPGSEYGRPQEDRRFCERARAIGYTVLVDFSVSTGHVAQGQSIGLLDFVAYYKITDWSRDHAQDQDPQSTTAD